GGRATLSPRARPTVLKILELTALAILAHISFSGVRVCLSLSAIDSDADPLVIGALLSVYALVPTILSLVGGRWIDRIGVRWPLFVGTGLMVLGGMVSYLLADLRALFVTSTLVGSGFLLSQLVMQKMTGDLGQSTAHRRKIFGILAIGYSVSGGIGPSASGVLYDRIGGQLTFFALASLSLLVMCWLLLRRNRLPGPAAEMPVQRRFSDLLKTPELRRLYIAVGLISSAWDVHQFVVPIYGRSVGLSASQVGFVLGAFGLATLVVRLILPLLSSLTEWRAIMMAQVVAAIVYVFYPMFERFEVLLGLSFALGLGLGVSQPMVLSLMHRVTPPGRIGEAAGLRLMIVNGTQTILPSIFGVLGNALGVGLLFWTVGSMVGLGVLNQLRAGYNDRNG
ncbi:MAG: MFS transporter, partial [Lautropia sp.]|nr:MFS transporter [Lautropia sp.]